ncbi:MAG: glycosyltransferase family 39 protein [Planctomycetota bacterium]|nr:glycosyltransferase family 39 protein [Planctomycetota bacterium]
MLCAVTIVLAAAAIIALACLALGLRALEALKLTAFARLERAAFAFALGLGALGLCTLALGLAGAGNSAVAGALLTVFILAGLGPLIRFCRVRENALRPDSGTDGGPGPAPHSLTISWFPALLILALVVLAVTYGLTSLLPPLDYDDLEYHLGAPAEYFRAGKVYFIPHNVYASFPQLVEMTYLHSMWLLDSPIAGAHCGRLLNLVAGLMICAAAFATARRWLSVEIALVGVLFFYSAPAFGGHAALSYVETQLALFSFLALAAFLHSGDGSSPVRWALLAGLFAGLAFGCKYTALPLVAAPLVVMMGLHAVAGRSRRRREHETDETTAEGNTLQSLGALPKVPLGKGAPTAVGIEAAALRFRGLLSAPSPKKQACADSSGYRPVCALVFAAAFAAAVVPWLIRNAVSTGNPFHPLFYSVFGGSGWDAVRDARFTQAHEPYARFRAARALAGAEGLRADQIPLVPSSRAEVMAGEISEGVTGTANSPPLLPPTLGVLLLLTAFESLRQLRSGRREASPDRRSGPDPNAPPQREPERAGAGKDETTDRHRVENPGADPHLLPVGHWTFSALCFFLLAYVFMWAATTHIVLRFLVPALPVAGIAAAAGIGGVRSGRWRGGLVAVALAVSAVYVWQAGGGYLEAIRCSFDEESREELLTTIRAALPIDALHALKTEWGGNDGSGELRADSLVIFVGEARSFYCEYPCIAPTVFDTHPFEAVFGKAGNAEELESALATLFPQRRLAILVNHSELERLSLTYRFFFEGVGRPGVPRVWDAVLWESVLRSGRWARAFSGHSGEMEIFVRRGR